MSFEKYTGRIALVTLAAVLLVTLATYGDGQFFRQVCTSVNSMLGSSTLPTHIF